MVEMLKFKQLEQKLRALQAKARKDAEVAVEVGYTAGYAVYVHENMESKHPIGQAKFLEEPARTLQEVLAQMTLEALRKGQTMAQALVLAGLRLQRESQKLCPIDTGNLRASAFTRIEGGSSS